MAKTRVTVNEDEQKVVEAARHLSKLQAKRRAKAADLDALDDEIAAARAAVGNLVGLTGSEQRRHVAGKETAHRTAGASGPGASGADF